MPPGAKPRPFLVKGLGRAYAGWVLRRTEYMRTLSLVLGVWLGLSPGGRAAPLAPEQLLPAETLVVLSIPNWKEARQRYEQSPTGRLWADPAMRQFKEKFLARLRAQLLSPLALDFGVKLDRWAELADGQLTLAYTAAEGPPGQGSGFSFLLLLDTGSQSNKLAQELSTLRQAWREAGRALKPVRIHDLEFATLVFSSSDVDLLLDRAFPHPKEKAADPGAPADKPPRSLEWIVGQSGALLIVGQSAREIEQVVSRQAGRQTNSLAGLGSFQSEAPLFRGAQVCFWANSRAFFGALRRQAATGGEAALLPSLIEPLGLDGLQTVAGGLRQGQDGTSLAVAWRVPEAERKGLFQILTPEPKDASPPPTIPGTAIKFSRLRIDLFKAWNTAEATLATAIPPLGAVLKNMIAGAGKEENKNFDFRERVISTLGDDLIAYKKGPRGGTVADLDESPSLLLLASRQPEQMAETLRALVSGLPPEVARYKEREFLGRTVYSLNPPFPVAGEPAGGRPRSLHYCASGGYVAFTADSATLEEYLRGGQGGARPLRDFPGLAEAAEKVGGMNTGGFAFENEAATWRAMIEAFRNDSTSAARLFSQTQWAGRLPTDGQQLAGWFDFALLPGFDAIARYFHFSVSTLGTGPEGLRLRAYWPAPPARP